MSIQFETNGNGHHHLDLDASVESPRDPLDASVERIIAPEAPPAAIAGSRVDPVAAEVAARALLEALGSDPLDEHLRETPRRVARAYAELLSREPFTPTTFPNDEGYDELVVVQGIPLQSLCMHHLLPFHGVAHVAYLPGERVVGLSKRAGVVEYFRRDLQIQARLTTQGADGLERELEPKGAGIVIEAEHMCMSLRGVQKPGARTVTSALRGALKDDARTRQEFLSLIPAVA